MSYRCRIKFCGLRSAADLEAALALGVDAVGFVLSESKRRIEPEACRELHARLPASLPGLGVVGPLPARRITALFAASGVSRMQITVPEDADGYWETLAEVPHLRAYRVQGPQTLALVEAAGLDRFVLDAYVPGLPGGTGTTFDWALAAQATRLGEVILAGGLTPENVGEAIRRVRPWMVDVSGGIEDESGVKDPRRMAVFVQAVRRAEKEIAAAEA